MLEFFRIRFELGNVIQSLESLKSTVMFESMTANTVIRTCEGAGIRLQIFAWSMATTGASITRGAVAPEMAVVSLQACSIVGAEEMAILIFILCAE